MKISEKTSFVLLCIAIVFATLAYGGVHQPVIAIFYVMVTISALLLVLDPSNLRWPSFSKMSVTFPLIAATAYAFIQIIPFGSIASAAGVGQISRTISLDPFSTWNAGLQMAALSIFLVALRSCLRSMMRIRRLTNFLVVFGAAYAFYSILQSIQSPDKIYGLYDVAGRSAFGSFVNRNSFAGFMLLCVLLPLGRIAGGSLAKDKKLLVVVAIVLMGVTILLCGSRGGLVAGVVTALIVTSMSLRSGWKIKAALPLLLLAAIIGGALFVGGDTTFTRIAETAASDDFSTDRTQIWKVTFSVIRENMPLGAGFGALGVAYTPFDDSGGVFRVEQAHNDYLQVLADAGIPGLIIGVSFLFLFFRLGWQATKISNLERRGIAIGAFGGCLAVLIHSAVDFPLHITAVAVLFLTLLALLSATQESYDDDKNNSELRT